MTFNVWTTQVVPWLIDQLKTHGLPFILLAGAVLWFNKQNVRLESKLEICNEEIIRAYRETSIKLIDVIERNNQVMKDLEKKL